MRIPVVLVGLGLVGAGCERAEDRLPTQCQWVDNFPEWFPLVVDASAQSELPACDCRILDRQQQGCRAMGALPRVGLRRLKPPRRRTTLRQDARSAPPTGPGSSRRPAYGYRGG